MDVYRFVIGGLGRVTTRSKLDVASWKLKALSKALSKPYNTCLVDWENVMPRDVSVAGFMTRAYLLITLVYTYVSALRISSQMCCISYMCQDDTSACHRAYLRTIEFYSYFVCITCCIDWSGVDFVLDITEDEIRLGEMLRLV